MGSYAALGRRRWLGPILGIVALLLLTLAPTAAADAPPATGAGVALAEISESGGAPSLTEEESLRIDATAYAESFGVSLDEAMSRVQAMSGIGIAADALAAQAPTRFAGGWFEHVPAFRAVIRVKGHAPLETPAGSRLLSTETVAIEFGAPSSFEELKAGQAAITQRVFEAFPEMSIDVDVREGAVRLAGPYDLESDIVVRLAAAAGVRVIAETSPPVTPEHTYGGKSIDILASDGTWLCTTGFTVRDAVSGLTGVLTAGHCRRDATTATYWETGSTSYQMSLGGVRWDRNQDFSWWRNTAHTVYPKFWDGYSLRTQTAVQSRGSMVGYPVCHFGRTTGYSCGVTTSITLNPGSTYCNGGPCDPVWVRVADGTYQGTYHDIKCLGGDSGGPYFWGSTAWGIHSGGQHTDPYNPTAADCFATVIFSAEGLTWDGVNTRIMLP